jgi:hypothetical protein
VASDFLGKHIRNCKAGINDSADSVDDRYLVRERIPIDLAVLCNIMERLFGLAIMTEKSRSYFHDVLLPQSWILALWKDFVTFKERALAPLYVLAQWTETLLKDVYTGKYLRDTIRDFDRRSEFGSCIISII